MLQNQLKQEIAEECDSVKWVASVRNFLGLFRGWKDARATSECFLPPSDHWEEERMVV